jgi:hypothetical protein
MSKIFRHHNGNDNLKDWDASTAYKTNTIDQITDPNGGNANNEITSIPSPFARMDLVKTAFKEVSRKGVPLDGSTIYHKMVSDSLDVGQLFFNFSQFKDKLNILSWDKKTDLDTLLNSSNSSHKLYGKTLELFLKQDANAYNFDSLQRIFLLEQPGHGTGRMHVIGGTSPATLFFASANDLSTSNFSFDADITFDDEYRSLDKRDNDYIRFWFFLRNCIPSFSSKFPEVDTYLDKVSTAIEVTAFRAELNNLNDDQYNDDLVSLTADGYGVPVEICGFKLRQKNISTVIGEIPKLSGFVIDTKKELVNPPLVLPNTTNTEGIVYINEPWPSDLEAPHFDVALLEDRVLPGIRVPYPYLTVSDFLEPYLIQLPYELDNDNFYCGDKDKQLKNGFFLPLKKQIFDYFDVQDIVKGFSGQTMIEFKESSSAVLVILRIPIKNGKIITFQRKYSIPSNGSSLAEIDENSNKGAIIPIKMSLNVMPFVKPAYMDGIFKVSLIDIELSPLIDSSAWNINFLNKSTIIPEKDTFKYTAISKKEDNRRDELKHFEARKNFDAIELINGIYKATVIPLFKEMQEGSSEYKFGIDFGTSNTHIEYSIDRNAVSFPFEITNDEKQIISIIKDIEIKKTELGTISAEEFHKNLTMNIFPSEITNDSLFNFPIRTAIQFNRRFNFDSAQSAFTSSSIPFYLNKERTEFEFQAYTDLKWNKRSNKNTDKSNTPKVSAYFDNLLFMLRNKVLLNGGNISKTKLVWTYPSSMTDNRINELEKLWTITFQKYFPNALHPNRVSESVAPFYYYQNNEGVVANTRSVIGLDIGGGTSDLVIYQNNEPALISSYQFAGNALFGDGYNSTSKNNGFVQKYLSKARDFLTSNGIAPSEGAQSAINAVEGTSSSGDIISMLFSLENNKALTDRNIKFNFSKILASDDTFKVVFFTFYAAQFFHLAKILQQKGINSPRYLVLSGTASKTIDFLDSSQKKHNILKLFHATLKYVSKDFNHSDLEIVHSVSPKEITAKGSLQFDAQAPLDHDKLFHVYTSSQIQTESTYENITKDDYIAATKNDYLNFIDLLKHLRDTIELDDKFGISSNAMETTLQILPLDYEDNLIQGINEKMRELDTDGHKKIKETLFFYPLVGRLNKIAFELYTNV